jgi:2,4-dienoyl-CoA reductase-like NADH-dependent reductase (Old Yellow Enzyme family)
MSACKAADPQVVTPAIIAAARDLLQASRAFNVAPDWVTTAQQTMEEALAAAPQQRRE